MLAAQDINTAYSPSRPSISTSSLFSMDSRKDEPYPSPSPPPPSSPPRHEEDVAGSVFLISASGELLRLPIPSTSPRDPLAWSWATRITAFVCVSIVASVDGMAINIPALVQSALHSEFPDRLDKWFNVKSLVSAMTFSVAFGFLVAIPASIAVGRRPVILAATLTLSLNALWAGLSGSYWQLLASIIFQGASAGGTLGVLLLMIMDATFIHERPMAFAIFWGSGCIFPSVIFIPFPFLMDPLTQWRPMYYIALGPCLGAAVLALLFIPETFFVRPAVAFDGRVLVQSSSETVKIYDDWEAMPCGPLCPHRNHVHEETGKSTWASRLKIRRAPGTSFKGGLATYLQMLLCLANPMLVWVSLLYAAVLSGVIYLSITLPHYLNTTRPLSEGGSISVWLGLSSAFGSFVAIPTTGPLISWCTRYLTLRGGGTRQAEYFLPGFIVPVITSVLSVGLFGLAVANDWSPSVYYLAFAFGNFAYVSGNVTVVLWITEAFPPWAAASVALQLFVGNIVAFCVGINLLAWVKVEHALLSNVIIIALVLILGAFAVPIAFWGKSVRQYIHGRWSESQKGAIRPN